MNRGLLALTKKRREHLQSCRDNGDNSHEIISDLYSDSFHFIYELLQNADDAGASEVIFDLTDKSLKVTHNGKKLFDINDVNSITTVGSSTKKDDVNKIGTFGAGFKSVFAITKAPHIHSGDFHFKITDRIVPEEIKSKNIGQQITEIILLFNRPGISADNACKQISACLRALESESLLFLRNIKKIQWRTKTGRGHYSSEIDGNKASLISQVNKKDSLTEYFLFTKNIKVASTKLNIVVAYRLSSDGAVVPVRNSKLFVFFPTNERTGFQFLVHAPYKTTPGRESIPFDDKQNQRITGKLSALVAESIKGLKNSGLLNVEVLSILPINSEYEHPSYGSAFSKVKEVLITDKLLPTSDDGYVDAENALLAGVKDLTTLLDRSDCSKLFENEAWLSTDITERKTGELRDYLMNELDIAEIEMKNFCEEINEEFIKAKPDDWVVIFYSSIKKNQALYRAGTEYQTKGVLRERPIIRLEDGSHINPENDSGDIQVYLPSKGQSKFKTVKRALLEDEESYEFLKSLGLVVPDKVAEIKEFIVPKYQGEVIDKDEYIEDVKSVVGLWVDSDEDQKEEICELLCSCWFVRCKNQVGDISFQKLKEEYVYFDSKILSSWFCGGTDERIYFIHTGLEETDEIKEFFKCLDVDDTLQIIEEDDPVSKQGSRYVQPVDEFNPNINIHGLENSLENINKTRSIFLWKFLLENNPDRLHGRTKRRRFLYQDFETGDIENTNVLESLKEKYWLYNKKSFLIKRPLSEILLDDLNDDYKKDHDDIKKLIKALGLKLDRDREIEEETGKKLISQEDYDLLQETKNAQRDSEKDPKQEDSWISEINPEDANPIEDETRLEKRKSEDLSGQTTTGRNKLGGAKGNTNNSIKPLDLKAIGDWGESVANKHLEEKYRSNEVVWLNKSGNIGQGYDFVIRNNGEDIAYYEVKSKTDKLPQLFQVSGTQWSWAKQLYDSGKGDMYMILLVSDVGKEQPKIKELSNPVELWKSGKLYADPVNIEL